MAHVLAGKYALIRPLGSGGMGVVYEARHTTLDGRRVAIKHLLPQFRDDPDVAERFVREARAASRVAHPGIVRVLDVERDDVLGPLVVLELLEGASLDVLARRGAMPWPRACALMRDALDAVAAAHAQGVIHRDLKPANLFVVHGEGDRARVKVLDFGLARLDATAQGLTEPGAFMGTPRYSSPEQRVDAAAAGAPSDVYSIGVTLLELLLGRVARLGSDPAQRARELDALHGHGVPDDVMALVARAIEPSLDTRFATAAAMRDALQTALEAHGEPWTTPWHEDLAPASAPSVPVASHGATSSQTPAPGGTAVEPRTEAPTPRAPGRPHPQPSVPVAPRRQGCMPAVLGSAVTLLVCIAAVYALARLGRTARDRRTSQEAARAAHTAPRASLACPAFDTSTVLDPAGHRLGAAAASIACDRARWILGGRADRVVSPPELTGVSPSPGGDGTTDPWHDASVREATLITARARARAMLDGAVSLTGTRVRVQLSLHDASGHVVARGSGESERLCDAVTEAMQPLVNTSLLPRAPALDPTVARVMPFADLDEALTVTDLVRRLETGARDDAACTAMDRYQVPLGPAWLWLRHECPSRSLRPLASFVPVAIDARTPGAFSRTAMGRTYTDVESDPGTLADRADALRAHETTAAGRAELSYVEGLLRWRNREIPRAHSLLRAAAEAAPREVRYRRALATMAGGTPTAHDEQLAFAAWFPEQPLGWTAPGVAGRSQADLHFANLLAPGEPRYASALAQHLAAQGRETESAAVVAALQARGDPFVQATVTSLRGSAAAREGRLAASLALQREAFGQAMAVACLGDGNDHDGLAMTDALETATVLGRATEVADDFAHRVLDTEPGPLDPSCPNGALLLAFDCMLASPRIAGECFRRLDTFIDGHIRAGVATSESPMIAGAERYVRGDLAGAVELWRTVPPNAQICLVMAPAFDRVGLLDLGDRCDGERAAVVGEQHGVNMAYVRTALRAARRGDHARATRLAQAVVEAWSHVDAPVPWVATMRALLAASPR